MRVDIEVSLVTATPDAEKHIELCGREAYGSAESPTIEGTRRWIRKRIEGWEHDVLEHAVATFHVVCSRVVSHELVRHRIASYTQRSMRFSESAVTDFILPPEVEESLAPMWERHYNEIMERYYNFWRNDAGYNRQTARYFVPHAAATSIKVTMNFRELRHFILMRAGSLAQPEMQVVAQRIWKICLTEWPSVFADLYQEMDKRGWLPKTSTVIDDIVVLSQ